ncbi:peptidoglycan recognition protein family protein [Chryseobacterium luquanense]|uniref:N-acetylmuramoyl-L-alanine amidase n=1 Tax=Chryseobacterium luquanense TaxID=2983766 RepID=A0ABT3Y4X0_9FLAO|nr:N-acetylmuramoyl-L-alanine amidase [Chryseobacterium luquanense]MCX8533197.1 N-acetylmuramoyl-L-alanine amidase [Chryseobacterium luquanense]
MKKVETPEKPQPPIKITITDTKQTVTNNELKEIYGDTPVIKDAYFAKKVEEKDKKITYEQIKSASIKDEVHIVVDTLNIPIGTEVKVKILEKGIINKDEYKEVSFLQDKKDVQGIFTTKIDYYDTDGDGEMFAVFTINLNNIDDKITQNWISKITSDKDKKLKLCIYVEVPSLKDKVVYCGDNMDLGEGIPKDRVWLDQPSKWFEVTSKREICPIDPLYRSHFVIHCTAGNMSEKSIKTHTKFDSPNKTRSKAHKYIMPDGIVIEIWPFTEKNVWATKAESKLNLKGQMFHIEINYGSPSTPTEQQYQSLAKLYVEASDTQDCWPIVVPHIEVDRGIPDGHSDPTDFDYNKFYSILKNMDVPIDEIPHFDHERYWGSPSYKIPMANDKNSWPPILKGNPHKS